MGIRPSLTFFERKRLRNFYHSLGQSDSVKYKIKLKLRRIARENMRRFINRIKSDTDLNSPMRRSAHQAATVRLSVATFILITLKSPHGSDLIFTEILLERDSLLYHHGVQFFPKEMIQLQSQIPLKVNRELLPCIRLKIYPFNQSTRFREKYCLWTLSWDFLELSSLEFLFEVPVDECFHLRELNWVDYNWYNWSN